MDIMNFKTGGRCAVIVARPSAETLWAGGLLSMHPDWNWILVALSGGNDPKQVQAFQEVASIYKASAYVGKLPDLPGGGPWAGQTVERAIMNLLPTDRFELLVTHALWGEYTRDLRHEEVGQAVHNLHGNQRLLSPKLFCFAYEDQDGQVPPRADRDAEIQWPLPEKVWKKKKEILRSVYGYGAKDWQVHDAPNHEAFWSYRRLGSFVDDD